MGNQAGTDGDLVFAFPGSAVQKTSPVAPIPTPGGKPFTLATGWVWALAGRDEAKRKLTVELAEFLTEPHFLASLDTGGWLSADTPQLFGLGVERRVAKNDRENRPVGSTAATYRCAVQPEKSFATGGYGGIKRAKRPGYWPLRLLPPA